MSNIIKNIEDESKREEKEESAKLRQLNTELIKTAKRIRAQITKIASNEVDSEIIVLNKELIQMAQEKARQITKMSNQEILYNNITEILNKIKEQNESKSTVKDYTAVTNNLIEQYKIYSSELALIVCKDGVPNSTYKENTDLIRLKKELILLPESLTDSNNKSTITESALYKCLKTMAGGNKVYKLNI